MGEIQAMIDINSCKSIRFIAKDMKMSQFLFRQVMHEDIWYFSYKKRKSEFLSQTMKDKERPCCKALEQTQASPATELTLVFLRWEKFQAVSVGEFTEQLLAGSDHHTIYQ